jgi:outer membrane protein assembly factor BamB
MRGHCENVLLESIPTIVAGWCEIRGFRGRVKHDRCPESEFFVFLSRVVLNTTQEFCMALSKIKFVGLMLVHTALISGIARATDWNQFRGPNRDNISTETGLLAEWPEGGPDLLWTGSGLGEGYSAVSVVGDLIFTMGNRDGGEFIIALDRSSGDVVWKTRNGNEYHDGTGNGPRGTPTVVDNRVYALGGNGDLTCCSADSGDVHWHRNILIDYQGSNITWGISESVLVDGDVVICTPGGSKGTVVALNAKTGTEEWASRVPESPQAAYASPVIAETGATKQYVIFTSKGIVGIQADNGKALWGQNKSSNGTANCATPLVIGKHIYSSSDYGTGAELIQISARRNRISSKVVYFNKSMKNHHGGMVHVDGYVYGSSSDILTCIDLKSGKPTWRQRSMKGSVVYADGRIVFRHEDGPVVLVEASSKAFNELGRFNQPERSGRPAWAHPVIAGKRLYLRDQDKLLVYDLQGS